jgi:putative phage-type endonuclease
MKAKKLIKTAGMPKSEWLKHRQNGIGGSEVGTILGLNPYQSSIELFYYKLGEVEQKDQNIPMFMGNFLEEKIAELYQYYDSDNESLIRNYEAGKKINKIKKINYILGNKQYPYLLGNIDRIQTHPYECLIEIKTISGYALNNWQSGIPPYFLAQLQAYMLITGVDKSKLVMLKDGRYLEVYEVDANPEFQSHIAEMSKTFWNKILYARELKAKKQPFEHLEPEPDNLDAYERFLKSKHKETGDIIQGTSEQYETAKKYSDCNTRIKDIETEQQGYKNILLNILKSASKIDFGNNLGYVAWTTNSKGSRIFNCRIKEVELKEAI